MRLKDVKKAHVNNWYESPPKWVQNLGDGLQSMALFILGYVTFSDAEEMKWLPVMALLIGAAGIFVQKLFKNE